MDVTCASDHPLRRKELDIHSSVSVVWQWKSGCRWVAESWSDPSNLIGGAYECVRVHGAWRMVKGEWCIVHGAWW